MTDPQRPRTARVFAYWFSAQPVSVQSAFIRDWHERHPASLAAPAGLREALDEPSAKLARAIGKVRFGGGRSVHFFDEEGWQFLTAAIKEARAALEAAPRSPEPQGADAERARILGILDEIAWGVSISPGGGPCEERLARLRLAITSDEQPASPETPEAGIDIDVDRLASVLHASLSCRWKPHAGFTANSDEEYHRQQAERIAARLSSREEGERP